MTITTTQKVIRIGSSKGVTIPAKDLERAGIAPGDEVDVVLRKHQDIGNDNDVLAAARDILKRYEQDFKNLANR